MAERQARGRPIAPMCVNPITWDKSEPLDAHLGAGCPILAPKSGTIQCRLTLDGVLEVTRLMLGGKLLDREDWHEGDFNLFWFNVEENVRRRTQNWLSSHNNHNLLNCRKLTNQ